MSSFTGPVAIGGVGGSGTRVYSDIAQKCGLFFGACQNPPLDSLAFTLIFKHRRSLTMPDKEFADLAALLENTLLNVYPSPKQRDLLRHLACNEVRYPDDAEAIETAFRDAMRGFRGPYFGRWGWKEPNTHFVVNRLLEIWPSLRYIHVYRDGRDMALSENQNQLKFWGPLLMGADFEESPSGSLRFWCEIHKSVFRLIRKFPGRVLLSSFEHLCADPVAEIKRLSQFMGVSTAPDEIETLAGLPRAPASIGRWKDQAQLFNTSDAEYARRFDQIVAEEYSAVESLQARRLLVS